MSPQQPTVRIRPTALQQAWLQEMGIDRRLLSLVAPSLPHKAAPPAPKVPKEGQAPTEGQAQPLPPAVSPTPGHGGSGQPGPRPSSIRLDAGRSPAPARQRPATAPAVPEGVPSAPPLPPAATLQVLTEQAAGCQQCRLHEGRSAVVFGAGVTAPGWLVVGEAPDAHDDRTGQPFAGPAGDLLRAMLNAVGIDRDAQVYATSLVKCRPLGNRPPEPDERQACAGFLNQQLAFLAPERILALGESAARHFAGPDATLDSLRGKALHYRLPDGRDVPVFVTHHPATLLLCPPLKAEAWHDLLRATGRVDDTGA